MVIITRFVWKGLFLLLLLFCSICSCKKNLTQTDTPNEQTPEPGIPLKTLPGAPLDIAERQQIGVNGGTFSVADGSISITIPAGALTAATVFSIQRITNTNTAGIGAAWRILPHQIFLKPVELRIRYSGEDIANCTLEALGVAFQDGDGVWQGTGGRLDTTQNTITVSTTHFSDWSLFKAFEIIPAAGVVEPGKTISLTVLNNMLDDYLPIPPTDTVKSLGHPRGMTASLIDRWQLNGLGKLQASGEDAEYTAPLQMPATNPVAVNVRLKGPGIKQYILVCNIYIGKPGIHFRINNGEWMSAITALDAVVAGGNVLLSGGVVAGNQPQGIVSLGFRDSYKLGIVSWGETDPYFSHSKGDNVVYRQVLINKNGVFVSPGGITFNKYAVNPGDYFIGTFYMDRAGKHTSTATGMVSSPVKADGFFMVKRSN